MIPEKYTKMLDDTSVIRDMFYFACEKIETDGADNVFDYTIGNPSVPVPQNYTDLLHELLDDENHARIHGYSPNSGVMSVREQIAGYLKRTYGIPYTAEHIFMTSGAASALCHAIHCVSEVGDEIVVFAPYFPEYKAYVTLAGRNFTVVPADTTAFQIHFDAFEAAITPKTAAVIVNSPCNPSGTVASADTLKKLAEILHKKQKQYGHDIFIISDEPYREIVFDGLTVPYVPAFYDNTLSCYSFSKSLSVPGDRIGYLAANPTCAHADIITAVCGQISRGLGHNCPVTFIQTAVGKLIGETVDIGVYETNMNLLHDAFTSLGFECPRPHGTFYIFPKALEPDANVFCEKAKKYNLFFVPGDSFGCPGYFRVAFCKGTDVVKRSLTALREFVLNEYPNAVQKK